MDRLRAELERGVERYLFRRVAAEESPLLDDHTREIIAGAIAWAVAYGISAHGTDTAHSARAVEHQPGPLRVAPGREARVASR